MGVTHNKTTSTSILHRTSCQLTKSENTLSRKGMQCFVPILLNCSDLECSILELNSPSNIAAESYAYTLKTQKIGFDISIQMLTTTYKINISTEATHFSHSAPLSSKVTFYSLNSE